MKVHQLEYLVESFYAKSYVVAAQNLCISSQAISKSIKDLENELGIKLFVKSGRRILPTEHAATIVAHAEEALADIRRIEDYARIESHSEVKTGSITLALPSTPCRGEPVNKAIFDQFTVQHPNITLVLKAFSNEMCAASVQAGMADCAIMMGEPLEKDLQSEHVFSAHVVIVMHRTNDLACRKVISLEDLSSATIATPCDLRCGYRLLSNSLEEYGINATFTNVEGTPEAHRKFLESGGLVVSFENTPLVNQCNDLTSVPLRPDDREFTWPLFFIYAKAGSPSPLPLLIQYLHDLPQRSKTPTA